MNLLIEASWEGNVRELKNFVQSVFVLENSKMITAETVSQHLGSNEEKYYYDTRFPVKVNKETDQVERELILRQLFLIRQDVEEIKQKLAPINITDEVTLNKMKDISRYIKQSDMDDINIGPQQDDRTMQEIERDTILKTMEKYYGSKRKTAQALGMSERTLYRKIKEYNLQD